MCKSCIWCCVTGIIWCQLLVIIIYLRTKIVTSYMHNMQAIGHCCNQLQSLNLGWCENVSDVGVMSLAAGCPDLRTLDLCGCVRITGILIEVSSNRVFNVISYGIIFSLGLCLLLAWWFSTQKLSSLYRSWMNIRLVWIKANPIALISVLK